ncbi:hypothetical protein MPTK1_1g17270 [Marchantia polymorpha subsp. ruderalis]|uniref:Uncharacterized protein n=2 Tax=Marchantia polymorpha TaxID=3197 RepID=A0AAF6AR60_MARPO|nr:hypothetical protein MARPO_0001s0067 [Marchantia polymorpha]BBM98930.1 hypothetical protein Mp_1g17270 [Marchantia polymorpha subsp. ruderalis]|eukprot:PTQ50006.1 hypothetical protein MARPO_0001s0067 [Marchantia polymorpha]
MSIVQCSCCGPCIRDDPSGEDDMEDRAMEVQFRPCREEEQLERRGWKMSGSWLW